MKKFLLFGGLGLLVVLGAVYIGFAFFLGSIAKGAINRLGPKVTQSSVVLESATISPMSGSGTLNGFTVGNPAGWSSTPAFHLGRVHLEVAPKTVFSDVIVINELTIEQPEFNYETHLVASNISDLLANIEKYTGSGEKETTKAEGPAKKFIVKKLRLTDGKATVGLGVKGIPVPLPEISLDNLGMQEGGLTGAQLSAVVLRDVLRSIVKAATEARGLTGADSLEKTKEAAKQIGDSVKDLFRKK